jgi:hypothetical protein
MAKKVKASELEFISRIKRDGSGVQILGKKDCDKLASAEHFDEVFSLSRLSITNGTYIASGFNSYVVRYKLST